MDKKIEVFANAFHGKKVLITGHTGFKGTWLCAWLLKLGAKVAGVSNEVPTTPSMFAELGIADHIQHFQGDIRSLESVQQVFDEVKPDFVFHLAAQAIVSLSYSDPLGTISTNVMGTANIMEVLRKMETPCIAIMITSDKCYDNVEWIWGYRESDHLGGKDIYSGSKGGAELVIKSYFHSFFKKDHPVRIAVGRAGNVIGGGDWAADRIVADCMRSWSAGKHVEIRSPEATRPWQHVLEPLSGYLSLAVALSRNKDIHGEAFNFGPKAEQNHTVVQLLHDLAEKWGFANLADAYRVTGNIPFHEAGLLKLNCDKALSYLKWESNLNYSETIAFLSDWYIEFYQKKSDMYRFTFDQITQYEQLGMQRGRTWLKENK